MRNPVPRRAAGRRTGALAGLSLLAAAWFSFVFFLALPALVLWAGDTGLRPPHGATRWIGGAVIAAGAAVWLGPLRRFVVEGRGTPAPIVPPAALVVSGLYTRVRNPMYLSYVVIAFGEAIVYRSLWLAVYALAFFGVAHLYVVHSEERSLRARFGADYDAYCERVGRWLPRRRID